MLEDYRKSTNFDYFCNGSGEEDIIYVEQILNTKFSKSYVRFLKQYGSAGIGAFDVHGIQRHQDMSEFNWHIIDKTNFYKQTQKLPDIDDWYVISDDGRGNPIGVDPQGVVWLSDHDSGFEKVKLADDFEEFLYKLLTDTLYE